MTHCDIHHYRIGGHAVCLRFCQPDLDNAQLLAAFGHFASEGAPEEEPLLTFTVDRTLKPIPERKVLHTFDTDNGKTKVYILPDEGYQFVIYDPLCRPCCLLIARRQFTKCECALNGTVSMRMSGLNNALMMAYAYAAALHDTLLIHASCVAWGGKAYAFTAPSGTGKSTHTSLWMSHIEGTELLNDDNPILRLIEGKAVLYGSPWSGKTPCYRNRCLPLGSLVDLRRGEHNAIAPTPTLQAMGTLLTACTRMMWDKTIHEHILATIGRVIAVTPLHTLHCRPDAEAAILSHQTLTTCDCN